MPKPDAALVQQIAQAIWDKKGFEVVAYDVSRVLDYTDAMIVCSAASDRHAAAVAENVVDTLRAVGVRPAGEEGVRSGRWALIDFTDVVVHVFHRPVRDYYELDRLYGDCPRMPLEEPAWVRDFGPADIATLADFDDGSWSAEDSEDDDTSHLWDGEDDDDDDDERVDVAAADDFDDDNPSRPEGRGRAPELHEP